MALDIYFSEDIRNAIDALAQANERALTLALHFGADPKAARLCRDIYAGALDDMGMAFGLRPEALTIPYRKKVLEGHELERR